MKLARDVRAARFRHAWRRRHRASPWGSPALSTPSSLRAQRTIQASRPERCGPSLRPVFAWALNTFFAGRYVQRSGGGADPGGGAEGGGRQSAGQLAFPRAMHVYVSAGTHWFGPPIRFGTVPAEVTLITLVSGDSTEV